MNLDKKNFINDFTRVIDWNFDSSASVNDTLDKWSKNKQWLYSKMNENLIVNSDYIKLSVQNIEEKIFLLEQFLENVYETSYLSDQQYIIFKHFCNSSVWGDGFVDNQISNDFDYVFISEIDNNIGMEDIHLKKGMRFSKSFKFFFRADQLIEIKDLQNIYSTFSQKFKGKKEGRIYLSIHPLDYLSISTNNCGWQSCHDLCEGDYRYGNMNYVADETTLVAYYTTDENVNNQELRDFGGVRWNSKQWRVLIHIKQDDDGNMCILYNKPYPHYSNQLIDEVDKLVMKYFNNGNMREKETLDNYKNFNNFYIAQNNPFTCHYSDIGYENNCNIRLPLSSLKEKDIYDFNSFITIGEPVLCVECGQSIASDENNGRCHVCKGEKFCEICGRHVYEEDLNYIEDDDMYICQYCYDDRYRLCYSCDTTVPIDETIYNETIERWECLDCISKRHENINNNNDTCLCVIDESEFLLEENLITISELLLTKEKIKNLYKDLLKKGVSSNERLIAIRVLYEDFEKRKQEFIMHEFYSYMYGFDIEIIIDFLKLNDLSSKLNLISDSNLDLYNFKSIILTGYGRPETFIEKKRQLELLNPSAEVTINYLVEID